MTGFNETFPFNQGDIYTAFYSGSVARLAI